MTVVPKNVSVTARADMPVNPALTGATAVGANGDLAGLAGESAGGAAHAESEITAINAAGQNRMDIFKFGGLNDGQDKR